MPIPGRKLGTRTRRPVQSLPRGWGRMRGMEWTPGVGPRGTTGDRMVVPPLVNIPRVNPRPRLIANIMRSRYRLHRAQGVPLREPYRKVVGRSIRFVQPLRDPYRSS